MSEKNQAEKNKYNMFSVVAVIIAIAVVVTVVTIAISSKSQFTPNITGNNKTDLRQITSEDLYGKTVTPDGAAMSRLNNEKTKNTDDKAWLYIPETKINYPVMQTTDNKFYQDKDSDKKSSSLGSLYFDYQNKLGTRFDLQQNTIIYGNNPDDNPDGKMFAQLLNFTNKSYAEKNIYIYLTTPTDKMIFCVFAAFYTDTKFNYIDISPTKKQFMDMTYEAYQRTNLIFNTDISNTDKILTLSTGTHKYGSRSDQRFVVMARLLRNSETISKTHKISVNTHPKQPQF